MTMETKQLNWETWIKQGDQYLKASIPKNNKSRFGTEIRYNLLSMSMESYIMAMLDFHKTLPDNHTYTDLISALEIIVPIDEKLKTRILKYENIQHICSIDKFHINKPTEEEIFDLKEAIEEIGKIAHKVCEVKAI